MIHRMMILAKILNWRELKTLVVFGAFIGFFFFAETLLNTFTKPYLDLLPLYNNFEANTKKPSIYNLSNARSDVYDIIGDVRIQGSSSTIFVNIPSISDSSLTVKPYARKKDPFAMIQVTTLKIKHDSSSISTTSCNATNTPAVIFSTGGYAVNYFHTFNEILLPLYYTSRHFNRSVFLLVFDKHPGWTSRYKAILDGLSRHDVVHMGGRDDDRVLCFPRAIVGLKANVTAFLIDDGSTIMTDFTQFLRSVYSLPRNSVLIRNRRPRMLVISRKKRRLVNDQEVAEMARGLGFEVVVEEMDGGVSGVAGLVNSVDVMVGVHGAGLTNMVFLPENGIVVQIVPFGLDNHAKNCFEGPAKSMKLRYLEYKAKFNESSLLEKYPANSNYTDIKAINRLEFSDFQKVYMEDQDLNVELGRFRKTLLKALKLLYV